jgi:ribosome maturation factor RimP
LSAMVAVSLPAGGERSGLTAHFFFGAKVLPQARNRSEAMAVKLDEIRKAADRVASSLGLSVVDVEFTGTAKSRILCIYLEKNAEGRRAEAQRAATQLAAAQENPDAATELAVPERFANGDLNPEHLSWLTHEDCAAFSRDFSTLLDVEDLIPDGEYTLEASSPGLDRKLSSGPDFERFQGCLAKVQTLEPIANNRHWQGRIMQTGPGAIHLDLTATKQNSKSRKTGVSTVEIALGNIEKAHLVPEF